MLQRLLNYLQRATSTTAILITPSTLIKELQFRTNHQTTKYNQRNGLITCQAMWLAQFCCSVCTFLIRNARFRMVEL